MAEGARNRRERAAAARSAAQAAERRRERTVRIVGSVTVAVVVLGIIGVAFWASRDGSSSPTTQPVENPAAALPAGVLPATDALAYGVPYGTAPAGAPTLALWEDFQCPGCGALEQANGANITAAAEAGKVRLVWRPTGFLDVNLGTDASKRAIAAWGCAIDAGKTKEYHDLVYANQPQEEGAGYSNELLLDLGTQSGLSGAEYEKFAACVDAGTYLEWAGNSTSKFYDAKVGGTPHGELDGVVVTDQIRTKEGLDQLLAGGAAAPSPSSS